MKEDNANEMIMSIFWLPLDNISCIILLYGLLTSAAIQFDRKTIKNNKKATTGVNMTSNNISKRCVELSTKEDKSQETT